MTRALSMLLLLALACGPSEPEPEPAPPPEHTAGGNGGEQEIEGHCRMVTEGVADVCQGWGHHPVQLQQCEGGSGTWGVGPCPSEGRLGTCDIQHTLVHHYRSDAVPDATPALAERSCTIAGGSWTPSPP